MKWVKIIGYTASALVLLLILLAAGGALWLTFYDWSNLNPRITDTFETLFGREAEVRGGVSVEFGLEPTLRVHEIVVKNPDWGSRPDMLIIPWLEARAGLFSLWQQKKKITLLSLSKPDFLLEQNRDGEWNFRPGGKDQEKKSSKKKTPIRVYIRDLRIEEGTITYRKIPSGNPYKVTLDRVDWNATGYRDPIQIEAKGGYQERPFTLSGRIGSEALLWGQESGRCPIRGEGRLGGIGLRFDGSLPDEAPLAGTRADVSAKGDDFAELMGVFGLPVSAGKPFEITTTFGYPEPVTYRFSETQAAVGESDYSGLIAIDVGSDPLKLTIEGDAKTLDLSPYLPETDGETEKTGADTKTIFPDRPLKLSFLKQLQGELNLKADTLLLPYLSVSDLTTRIDLSGGRLQVDALSAAIGAGMLAGRLALDAGTSPPTVMVDMTARRIALDKALENLKMLEGNVEIAVDIKGRGATCADMAAGLNGNVQVSMNDGRFYNDYLRMMGQNIFATLIDMLNPFDKTLDHLRINCLVCRLGIEEGMATVEALVLDTPQVGLVGKGRINLETEAIDIPINTLPRQGVGIEDVVTVSMNLDQMIDAFRLSGSLANPSLEVDAADALFSIGETIGSVAVFGPAGVAAALMSGSVGNRNPCELVLEGVPERARERRQEAGRQASEPDEGNDETSVDLERLKIRPKRSAPRGSYATDPRT
jgi:hypothetical protein